MNFFCVLYSFIKMKKINLHPSYLQILYLIITVILFSFIVYTPTFVQGPVHISKRLIIEENTIEGILLGILFIVSILILSLYKLEVNKHKNLIDKIKDDKKKVENRLIVSDQYIGKVNVQIREIKSTFNSIDSYPGSKNDFKKTFSIFGERILGVVKSNWVLIRIINCNTQRTISERFETIEGFTELYPHISNKLILEDQPVEKHTSVIYNPKNLNILVFCIMPVEKISEDERTFIHAILDELTKLYVIINSSYYKNENKTV